jgi:hypothetical protein
MLTGHRAARIPVEKKGVLNVGSEFVAKITRSKCATPS